MVCLVLLTSEPDFKHTVANQSSLETHVWPVVACTVCPGLNSVGKFTKVTKFDKSATKIVKVMKITKFCMAINKK